MSKKIKALIIGGVLLVVLIGVLVLLLLLNQGEGETSSSSSSTSTIVAVEKNVSNVTNVTIKNQKDEISINQEEDGTYTVEALRGIAADQTDTKTVFSKSAVVEAMKIISESPEDLEEYGLSEPKTTVTVHMNDGTSYEIYVGILSPLGDGYYVMVQDDPKLYLVSQANLSVICNYANKDYVYRTLASNPESDDIENLVQKVVLYRKDIGRELVFEQLENDPDMPYRPTYASAYTMTSPIKAYADGDNFYNVAGPATALRADSVVAIYPTEEQLKEYGLDNPQATYAATMTDGTQLRLRVGNACYGDPTDEDAEPSSSVTGYYFMADGLDAVFYVDYGGLSFMTISEFDMLSQIAFGPDIYYLESFTIEAQGKTYQFDLTQTQVTDTRTETSGTMNGVALDDDKLANFYVYVISALAEGLYTDAPSGDPILTFTFNSLDENVEPLVVEFHDVGDRKASITINGQTRFYTRMAYVTTFYSNLVALENGEDINLNY
ncbi:MAG: DUF4340 domain-containing protein [Oscillospiraceae bacterium]|jgi:hypothetical protein